MKRNASLSSPTAALLTTLLLTPLAALHAADAPQPAGKPNIIFILADDYGIPGVGCYGGALKTPNLDKLAAGGTRFEYCFAAPLCAPSRALCMFGRYAFRTGVLDNNCGAAATPQKEVCIAKTMKTAGYATAVAGKWRQLGYFTTREDGARWGWDEFLIWGVGSGDKGNRYWDPTYNRNGQPLSGAKGRFGPDVLHEFVVDFIRRHRDEPFFIYYPTTLIHGKLMRTPDSRSSGANLYADNIAYMDKLVGKLAAELDQLKLREKTLIVFTGDNGSVGQGTGTINGRHVDGHKGQLNEGGSRVPLIANWPRTTPAGVVSKDLVDFSDFYATFADLGGAKLPEGVKIDGRSFAQQLRGEKGAPREWIYVQLGSKWYVRDQGFKLTQSGALLDMADAPFGEKPVANDAARAKLQAALDELKPGAAQSAAGGEKPGKKRKNR